jgi:hypothetical protein
MKRVSMHLAAALAAAALLSGCSWFGSTKPDEKTERELYTAALTQAFVDAATKPLFKLSCPPAGCTITSIEVSNPQAIVELSRAFQVATAPPAPVPPWWAQPLNTVVSAIAQIGSIHYGLAGVGKIVSAVTGGMMTVATNGFGALERQGGAAFAAYDRSTQAGWNAFAQQRPPNVQNTWNNTGDGNNFGSGSLTYTRDPITGSYNPVNPAPTVVTCSGTPPVCSR